MPAVNTWNGATSGDYAAVANWREGDVPDAGESAYIVAGAGAITSNLDQSAVAILNFIVESGYANVIGVAPGAAVASYLQIDPDRFDYSASGGSAASYIDIGSANISPTIYSTNNVADTTRGLFLKGSNIATLNIIGGSVGVAAFPAETSTVATLRCVGSKSKVWVGSGTTLTTYYQENGNSTIRCAATTINMYGGVLYTREVGAITTINMYGGTLYPESIGTITTLNLYGGTVNMLNSAAARTITTLTIQNRDAIFLYDKNIVTVTTFTQPGGPVRLTYASAQAA